MTDRVLTVRQPFADLEIAGVKPVENRTRPVPSTLPQWQRCRVCGRREPRADESSRASRPCMLDDWEPDGPFPFRLWIHAAKLVDHPPLEYEDGHRFFHLYTGDREASAVAQHIESGTWHQYLPPDYLDPRPLHLGALLGHVTVTGCHHADECRRFVCINGHDERFRGEWLGGDQHECQRRDCHAEAEPVYCSRWAEPGVWHWTLAAPVPLDEPIPMRGALGLWRLPAGVPT